MDSETSEGSRRVCPSCKDTLVPVGRHGVQIDCCPGCGGIWLDRGELEKIMERSYRNRAHGYFDDDEEHWGMTDPSSARHVA